jgi:flagellar basal body-associated protein FliL
MAEEEDKPAEAKEASSGSSSKGLVVVVLIAAVVLGGGAAAAGAMVAMRMGGQQAAPAPSASAEGLQSLEFASIVVDVHSADGVSHHLRVSLAAEVPLTVSKEEVQSMMPRSREAAIGYLRSLTYEQATAPHSFEKVKEELSKRIVESIGEKRVAEILVTDFVAQ